ncbi:MAG: hypothetical protein HRT89_08265 [Lentisphaeria bacterium]|nr:hypothetical protein [Lentisphaeria bacterium]NQZ68049.1 hypothetical protein [Lentisphaeria bacterium]
MIKHLSLLLCMLLFSSCSDKDKDDTDLDNIKDVKVEHSSSWTLVLEAESGDVRPSFETLKLEGDSLQVIHLPLGVVKDKNKAKGIASYKLDLDDDREVNFWFRVKWNGTCANSFNLRFTGEPAKVIGDDDSLEWHWVRGPQDYNLSKGEFKFDIEQREDDIMIDQIYLTDNKTFVPQGIEK